VSLSTLRRWEPSWWFACLLDCSTFHPSMRYYSSSHYDVAGSVNITNFALQTSLMCSTTTWVPCPNCTFEEFNGDSSRFASLGEISRFYSKMTVLHCNGTKESTTFVSWYLLL
jgi:hypothetical protein